MKRILSCFWAVGFLFMVSGYALPLEQSKRSNQLAELNDIQYKTIDANTSLSLKELKGQNEIVTNRPCIILLSGGGWLNFSWGQLKDLGQAFSDLGAAVFIVEYRTFNNHGSTPVDALEDVQDAIAYLRLNSAKHRINSNQIIAIGTSAGAHLAFASGMSNSRDLKDLSPYRPNIIVAFSPVLRNDSEGYAFDRIQEDYTWFSPYNVYSNTQINIPPSLVFSGIDDKYIAFKDLEKFSQMAAKNGDTFVLRGVQGANHSMRNYYDQIYMHSFPEIKSFLLENDVPLFELMTKEPLTSQNKQTNLIFLLAGIIIALVLIWALFKNRKGDAK
ncbi:MAG: alpha/beta hydrolase [Gilvibacter sp.]